jgi:hypothetical protein
MAPEDQFLEDEETADARDERKADFMNMLGARALDSMGKQREECSTQQRAGCETHEVRERAIAKAFRQQQEQARDAGAHNSPERGEQQNPGENAQARNPSTRTRLRRR